MLESYIAPLFTGYVEKYIKNLKPEDLSLSLWGGDLVLQNLEINLDVLQQELNLPVEFLSGKIHKFQLHVPWTRLIYDPVLITINTMEFIVKLKDPNDEVSTPAEKPSEDVDKEPPIDPPTNTEELPPSYVQGILNKVINNVSFQIHNIIIKYVEDDIVFSLNIKSLDFHSSDEDWNYAFTELKLPNLLLRRVCEITDLTICLDQRNPSGKIELYQDPVLYKCNLSCRILSHYKGLSSYKPYENALNVYCESFDFSFTDHQVPMVIRLIKLIIGLYYGSLELPGCNVKLHIAPKVLDQHKQEHSRKTSNVLDNTTEEESSESWASWALSMVPGMASVADDNQSSGSKFDVKTTIGIYITLTTVTLKRTNQFPENIIDHQRLEFSPVLCIEVCGCVIECVAVGELLIDFNLGLQSVVGYTVGNQCVCSMLSPKRQVDEGCGDEPLLEDDVFMKVGVPAQESEVFSFLQRSLFASFLKDTLTPKPEHETTEPGDIEDTSNESLEEVKIISSEDSKLESNLLEQSRISQLDTNQIVEIYGGMFVNYYYEMFLPDLLSSEIENIFLYPDIDEKVKEISERRIHIASCQLYLTTKFVHFMTWFVSLVTANIPERKIITSLADDNATGSCLQASFGTDSGDN